MHKKNREALQMVRVVGNAFVNLDTAHNFGRLVDLCASEERDHRRWGPDFRRYHPYAPSVAATARFFAVYRVGEYLSGRPLPALADYLRLQKSTYLAAALVLEFGDAFRAALASAGYTPAELAALDYSTLVSPEDA